MGDREKERQGEREKEGEEEKKMSDLWRKGKREMELMELYSV